MVDRLCTFNIFILFFIPWQVLSLSNAIPAVNGSMLNVFSHHKTVLAILLAVTIMGKIVLFGLVGEKWKERKKGGELPLLAIPRPVQPPLGLMFDILSFKYRNRKRKKKISKNGNINTRRQRIYKPIQSLVFSSMPAN